MRFECFEGCTSLILDEVPIPPVICSKCGDPLFELVDDLEEKSEDELNQLGEV